VARRLVLTAAVVVALLPVAGALSAAEQQTPKRGGTLVMGTLNEPACLNALLLRCTANTPPAEVIMRVAIRGAFEIGARFSWEPDLVSRVDVTTKPPFTLTYRIRPEARWSDGVPITAGDFVFTHEALKRLPADDRTGLEPALVRSVRAVDAKTVRVVLRSRFAGWHGLFRQVLPAHTLRGQDLANLWRGGIDDPRTGRPIGSGRFLVERWDRGRSVTFVRNARYWGPRPAYLDRIVLRFCASCADPVVEQLALLRDRDLGLAAFLGVSAQQLQEFRRISGVRVLAAPAPLWEHIDLNVARGGHPAVGLKPVRQALAYGLDRTAIARSLHGYGPSESAVFSSVSRSYRPNWQRYRHRPDEARRLLELAGCRRAVDGVYVCAGERLALRLVTTASREQTARLVQAQLARVGVAVEVTYATIRTISTQVLPSGDFDLALFNWIRTDPDTLVDSGDVFGCGGAQNYSGYCQRLVTRDLDQARRILDAKRLEVVLNRADRQLANDVPVIPLVERPVMAAFDTSVRGVNLKTGAWNPFQSAENWWLDD
jgi:peptide/nickel transport system substrate-binding protein